MANKFERERKYKPPSRAKKSIRQYLILCVVLFPFIALFAIFVAPKINNAFVEVLIYVVITLGGWTLWIQIRKKLDIRAERIRKMREEQKQKVENAIKLAKAQEEKERKKEPMQKTKPKTENKPNLPSKVNTLKKSYPKTHKKKT